MWVMTLFIEYKHCSHRITMPFLFSARHVRRPWPLRAPRRPRRRPRCRPRRPRRAPRGTGHAAPSSPPLSPPSPPSSPSPPRAAGSGPHRSGLCDHARPTPIHWWRAAQHGSEFSNSNEKKITLELVKFHTPIPVGESGYFFLARSRHTKSI